MSSVYVFRIGPVTTEGDNLYIHSTDRKGLQVVDARNDADGLRQLAEQLGPEDELLCELQLAQAGAALGFTAAEMSPRTSAMRANIAMGIALDSDFSKVKDLLVSDQFLWAAGAFWRGTSRHWWPVDALVDVEVTGGATPQRFEGMVVREPLPMFVLFDELGSVAQYHQRSSDEREVLLEALDNARVTFEPGIPYVLEPLDMRYGLDVVPRPELSRAGEVLPIDEDTLLVLAAALAGMGNLDQSGRPAYGQVEGDGVVLRGFVNQSRS